MGWLCIRLPAAMVAWLDDEMPARRALPRCGSKGARAPSTVIRHARRGSSCSFDDDVECADGGSDDRGRPALRHWSRVVSELVKEVRSMPET